MSDIPNNDKKTVPGFAQKMAVRPKSIDLAKRVADESKRAIKQNSDACINSSATYSATAAGVSGTLWMALACVLRARVDAPVVDMMMLLALLIVIVKSAQVGGKIGEKVFINRAYDKLTRVTDGMATDKDVAKLQKWISPHCWYELSKISPRYFNALVSGRLDFVSYDVAENIMQGHLLENPNDYARLVARFREEELPRRIVERHKMLENIK